MNNMKLAGYIEGYMTKKAEIDYGSAAVKGGLTGMLAGGVLGDVYAQDQGVPKLPRVVTGGLIGGGVGAGTGLAIAALVNRLSKAKKDKKTESIQDAGDSNEQ